MFSLDTVLAVLTVYKTGQNPKARLVVSRGPWVWVQPCGWGPRGLPGATPAHLCLPSRVHVQSGHRPVTPHRTWQSCCSDCSCPVSPGRGARSCRSSAGARAKGRGERHSQQTQMVPPALLMPRQTALWAVFEPQTSSERLSFPIPVGNLERLYINIFVFTASGQVKVIFSLCNKLT